MASKVMRKSYKYPALTPGLVINEWTLISPVVNRTTHWLCRCSCGNKREVNKQTLARGDSKRCSSCVAIELNKRRLYKRKPSGEAGLNRLIITYRAQAKKRGLSFSLSKENVRLLTGQPCTYCGCEPNRTVFSSDSSCREGLKEHTSYLYNGIDRLDNSKGYELDNCVSCCKECNWAKNKMSVDEFTAWIKKVFIHLNLDSK